VVPFAAENIRETATGTDLFEKDLLALAMRHVFTPYHKRPRTRPRSNASGLPRWAVP
jgi:hypothetical protein